MEADVAGSKVTNGSYIVDTVDSITGIALDNSSNDVPAFAGAIMLASLQCFEGGNLSHKKIQGTENPPEEIHMTFAEWKAKLSEYNVHPSDIFTIDEIQKDREFVAVFNERDALKTENGELKETAKTATETAAKQEKTILRNDAKSRLDSFIPKDATEGQKAFIAKKVASKFDKLDDLSDDGLKGFVNENIEDYNDFGNGSEKPEELDENGEKKKIENSEEISKEDEAFNDVMGEPTK
jgi:hypothetical protein